MIPAAKRTAEERPARGWSALAACCAVCTCVIPWRFSTAALVAMMQNITIWLNAMPVVTSTRAARISVSLTGVRWRRSARSTSTSDDACQKNRYGLIVVPRMATMAASHRALSSTCGTMPPTSTLRASGWTTKSVMTYAKSASVSHLKIDASRP